MKFNIWKYIYIVLFVAFVPLISWANPEKRTFTLVIDAGHGGHDAGAVGAFSKEKNINLKVALAFGKLVESNCPDVKVIYTRSKDVFIPLQTRADIANRNKADLFISVHTNALPAGRQAYGSETYTLGMARASANLAVAKRENSVITLENDYQSTYKGFDPNKAESYVIFEFMQDKYMKQSVDLASCIQREYTSAGRPNKGVHQAGFLVLRNTSMPSVLTELGFITTPSEEAYLNSEQGVTELSRSIYNGFLNYRRMHERAANDIPANLPNRVVENNAVPQEVAAAPAPASTPQANVGDADDDVAVVPVAAVPTERLVAQAPADNQVSLRSQRSQTKPQPRVNKPAETSTPRKEVVTPKPQPKAVETVSKVEKKEDNKAKQTAAKHAPAKATPAKPLAKDVDSNKKDVAKKTAPKKEVEKKEPAKPFASSKTSKDKPDTKNAAKDKKAVDAKKTIPSKDNAKDNKTSAKKDQDKKAADKKGVDKKTIDAKKSTSAKDKDNKTNAKDKKDNDKKTTSAKANVTYRIQVGAGKTQIDTKDAQFKGLSVNRVKEGTMNKYFYGTYHSYAEAQKALKMVKAKISSAYIVAYVGGKSVSVAEARDKENSK